MRNKTNWVYDIETMVSGIIWCFLDYASDDRKDFVLWRERNELDELFKFLHESIELQERYIGYNSLNFDSQIIEWMLDNEAELYWMSNEEAVNEIYNKAQQIIQRSFNSEFQDYPEWRMRLPQLDIFKMNHWDNQAKHASLKWLQCSIDWHNVEDMPYPHTHYIENDQQLNEIKAYCYNDCRSTKKILYLSKENVDLRRDLTKEYGINVYSASEPRMSKELFLYFLSKKTGIERKELKQYSTRRDKIEVGKIILPYVSFKRQEFVMLLNNFRRLVISGDTLRGAFKYNVKYRGISIDYGVGGIHGFSKPDHYVSDGKWMIKTSDVESYYPNLSIKNKWAPAHIPQTAFCEQYEWFFWERKKYPKGTPKNYLLKILLNSTFGLSIDKTSFLSDPQLGCQITINGQLLLTMLLEMLCEGIPEAVPLVLNTDGLEMKIPRSREADYLRICKEWEELTKLTLEHDAYKALVAFDCNNYIAVSESGKTKCKGRFEFEPHDKYKIDVLHKNKSFLVVCKAIYEYFVNGKDPEEFIRGHRNIFDFCGFARAKGKWKFYTLEIAHESNFPAVLSEADMKKAVLENGWEEYYGGTFVKKEWIKNRQPYDRMATTLEEAFSSVRYEITKFLRTPIQKTLRYFMSNSGSKVVKYNEEDKRQIQVVAGRNHITVFNKFEERPWEEYDIDYNFYIKQVRNEINLIKNKPLEILFPE